MGIRKFRCETCGKTLSSKQNFVDHKNTHTGDKPYVCDVFGCKATFRQLSQFYIHKQMHDKILSVLQESFESQQAALSILGKKLTSAVSLPEKILAERSSFGYVELPKIESLDKNQDSSGGGY
jgi:uncharacterized Zn-finger protein